jgi:hypothetical protein
MKEKYTVRPKSGINEVKFVYLLLCEISLSYRRNGRMEI